MVGTIYNRRQVEGRVLDRAKMTSPDLDLSVYDDFLKNTDGEYIADAVGAFLDVRGGVRRWTSGAVAGNRNGPRSATDNLAAIQGNAAYLFRARVRTPAVVNQRAFVGLFRAVPTAAAPPVEPAEAAYFRRDDGAGAANWFAVTRNGGAETPTDTTIVGDANFHTFEIEDLGDRVVFRIDGVVRATHTTNRPAALCNYGAVTVTEEAVAKSIDVDYFAVDQARA